MSDSERVLLVGCPPPGGRDQSEDSLAELARLASTARLRVVGHLVQPRRRVDPATFIGAGKVQELAALRADRNASAVIFDDPLTPAQQRNLERAVACKVLDRSALILDIFAQHARTLEGKLQVELAQLEYLRPRLTRHWTHLSRLGGGVGTRGPGETQLEVDRRRIRERIAQLRRRLTTVERSRALHRRERHATPCPAVALVGYTNTGKSTLMNRLTRAGVGVADQLFATLDPTVRRLRLPTGLPAVLVDTVGFIHKLPHELIEAFKSTLEEVRAADLLVHVIDASAPSWPRQAEVVLAVLEDIGAGSLPVVTVFNKCDRLPAGRAPFSEGLRVSARTGEGTDALLRVIADRLELGLTRIEYDLPAERSDVLVLLRRGGRIVHEHYTAGRIAVTALVPPRVAGRVRRVLA